MFWRPGFIRPAGTKEDEELKLDYYTPHPRQALDAEILSWYAATYPTDDLALERLTQRITFNDAYEALQQGDDIYSLLKKMSF